MQLSASLLAVRDTALRTGILHVRDEKPYASSNVRVIVIAVTVSVAVTAILSVLLYFHLRSRRRDKEEARKEAMEMDNWR
ncbi:hypothetical protein HJFPF1_10824 [Paramyrothecium foliicola]|nr:hypothetical protein HJFPF1_10824 [Paramyrothecium foliicola]